MIGDLLAKQAAHFDVLGDGNSLLSGGVDVAPSSGLVHKSIRVVGVRRLTLVVTVSGSNPQAMFGNPRIVPDGASSAPTTAAASSPAAAAAWLDELSPVDGRPDFSGVFVVNGRDIPHGVGFNPQQGVTSQVSYDLGGHYATFEVDLVIGDLLAKQAAHFDVLGDGNSLLSGGVDVAPSSGLVHKSIRVVGVRRLTLVVTVSGSNPQAMFGNPRIVP